MNRTFFVMLGLLVASTLPSQAQYNKYFNKEGAKSAYGIQYVLPKTYVTIFVTEKKTVYTPGELCQYAERYLKLTDVPTEPSTQWTFLDAKLQLNSKADSSKVFFVPMSDKITAPLMELTAEGTVKSINMPISPASSTSKNVIATSIKVKEEKGLDPHTLLSEDILMAGSTAKMAELVAKEIYNIRESRSGLVKGEADNLPKDGAQLKIMLDNLDAQEKALTSMFTGKYRYEERIVALDTDISEMDNQVLFRFSNAYGVVGQNDLSGRPFYMTIRKQTAVDVQAENPEKDKKKKGEELEGVAYNIPGRALLTLKDGSKQVATAEFLATQFGSVEFLAPTLFNKKNTVCVSFDSLTGSILKIDRSDSDK